MTHRFYCLVLLSTALLLLAAAVPFVYRMDPYQFFHPHTGTAPSFSDNQRLQNIGLIRSYLADPAQKFDSVILGTSMSENFTPSQVADAFGWQRALKLLMSGSTPAEQQILFERAIATGRVQHVLWGMDSASWAGQASDETHLRYYFPEPLYRNDALAPVAYLINRTLLMESVQALKRRFFGQPLYNNPDIDRIGYWYDLHLERGDFDAYSNPAALTEQKRKLAERTHWQTLPPRESFAYPALEAHLKPLVERHCNNSPDFAFFVPPYSRFYYAIRSSEDVARQLYFRRALLELIAPCRNMALYAFDNVEDITANPRNYKDDRHHNARINDWMAEEIAAGRHRLTTENIPEYEKLFTQVIRTYRLE